MGAIKNEPLLCDVTIEKPNRLGDYTYSKCGRKAKYRIKYKNHTGKMTEHCVCGIHFVAAQKDSARIKRLGYDTEFEYEAITENDTKTNQNGKIQKRITSY